MASAGTVASSESSDLLRTYIICGFGGNKMFFFYFYDLELQVVI